jgi:hypothetical protein
MLAANKPERHNLRAGPRDDRRWRRSNWLETDRNVQQAMMAWRPRRLADGSRTTAPNLGRNSSNSDKEIDLKS